MKRFAEFLFALSALYVFVYALAVGLVALFDVGHVVRPL